MTPSARIFSVPAPRSSSTSGFAECLSIGLAVLLLLPSPVVAAAPSAPPLGGISWGSLLVGLGLGAGIAGVLYWLRTRRRETEVEARADALRAEKQAAETARDMATDRAEKLETMSTAKSEFLEEVSHAFRRPLTLTLGPIDAVLDERYGTLSNEAHTQLRLAQRNGIRVLWLVDQLLDLAELETGSMTLQPAEGNLTAFVTRSLHSFEDLAERRGVSLGFESTLDTPTVAFDEAKMETILANLLSSAFRAAEANGSIRVAVRPAPDADEDVELLVTYTGDAPADPYGDASTSSSLQEPGSVSASVGLRLASELADLHGGHLHTDRDSGKRTRFVVRLPRRPEGHDGDASSSSSPRPRGDTIPRFLKEEGERGTLALSRRALSSAPSAPASTPRPSAPTLSPNPSGDGALPGEDALPDRPSSSSSSSSSPTDSSPDDEDRTTILVIDDNSVICTLVRVHLEPEYRVEVAHDGAEGYTLARSLLPDLVISDVMMPEVDGFELCKNIKKDPDIDHIPVVFLTARADLKDKVEGFDLGADAYLTKPFEPAELIARIENLIATRQSLRESFRTEDADEAHADTEMGLPAHGLENAESALPATAEARSLQETIEEAIAESLTDPDFGVSELASATALSASQLRRRMKELYDRTPVQLIRRRRLEAGARLLREREDATIGEVAYAVGFNSQSYFSRSFREEFGTSPSRYRSEGVAA